MNAPKSLKELVTYLESNPRIRVTCTTPGTPVSKVDRFETFQEAMGGGLWFVDDEFGGRHYLPVDCGLPAAEGYESGVEFRDDGFDFTKFGVTLRHTYLPN